MEYITTMNFFFSNLNWEENSNEKKKKETEQYTMPKYENFDHMIFDSISVEAYSNA